MRERGLYRGDENGGSYDAEQGGRPDYRIDPEFV
jgi:hypothetical protein